MASRSHEEKAALKLLERTVKDHMDDHGVELWDASTPIAEVRRRFARHKARLVVVRRGDELAAMLAPHQLPEQPGEDEDRRGLDSLDLPPLHALAPGDGIVDALETMLRHDYQVMPVREPRRPGKIAGLLRRKDLDKVLRALWATSDSHLLLETGHDRNQSKYKAPPVPDEEAVRDPAHPRGDILLYVPDDRLSVLIDAASGGYGYSHMATDCGEVHRAMGKPLIIEGTTSGVRRDFLDVHGGRAYARVCLLPYGVDPDAFYECLRSKLGEPYDFAEVFSAGWLHSPVKQTCSDIVTVCLPEALSAAIVACVQAGQLHPGAVAVRHGTHNFISPNAYAEYFGVPPGKEVAQAAAS